MARKLESPSVADFVCGDFDLLPPITHFHWTILSPIFSMDGSTEDNYIHNGDASLLDLTGICQQCEKWSRILSNHH
jgi:hypothetical protein